MNNRAYGVDDQENVTSNWILTDISSVIISVFPPGS